MQNQVKYFILFSGILLGLNAFAQGSDCSTAIPAIIGLNTSDGPSTGEGVDNACFTTDPATNADWYTYTASTNTSVTIESCLGGADTRVSVFAGTCTALTCVSSNDDFCEFSPGSDAWASTTSFPASAGTTYYIQWDDRWDTSGFDWSLSETPLDCPILLLNIGDTCDIVGAGDGVVSDVCECVPLTVPDCATLLVPVDGATAVEITPLNNGVEISWSFNGFQPSDGTNIYWGTNPTALDFLGAAAVGTTGVTVTGVTPEVYYWMAVPFNALGEATGCDIFMFDTSGPPPFPECPTLLSPADSETDVVLNGDTLIFTWINANNGAPATANGFYFGNEPGALTFLGNLTAEGETVTVFGLEQGLTYFWSVVPSSGIGEALNCDIFSFTVAGTPDCPLLGLNGLNIGNDCDDGDGNTLFEQVSSDCICVGLPIAPNAPCISAEVITDGVYLANRIIGGGGALDICFAAGNVNDALWYSYTAICDGDVTVRSSIDLDQPDTRLSIYTGTCAALVCEVYNDDIDEVNFTSSVTFLGTAGTTYLIEWDDRWGTQEFDFEIITGSSCPSDFNNDLITNGDDFSLFLGNFGLACGDPCVCPTDLNKDEMTNGDDFSEFLGNYGLSCPASE